MKLIIKTIIEKNFSDINKILNKKLIIFRNNLNLDNNNIKNSILFLIDLLFQLIDYILFDIWIIIIFSLNKKIINIIFLDILEYKYIELFQYFVLFLKFQLNFIKIQIIIEIWIFENYNI